MVENGEGPILKEAKLARGTRTCVRRLVLRVRRRVDPVQGSNIDGKKVALVNVNPPTSIPSISHIEEPDSM